LNFLQILECLNYLDLIQINAKEKEKGTVHPELASTWPSCLGWLGLGWQPIVKKEEAGEL
jgi:hypothetical protein